MKFIYEFEILNSNGSHLSGEDMKKIELSLVLIVIDVIFLFINVRKFKKYLD
jgi:hypothetical protein